jgi:hypothetical protein
MVGSLGGHMYGLYAPERWIPHLTLAQFDEVADNTNRVPLTKTRVWLRADCDFVKNTASFRYSTDGATYAGLGEPHLMAYGLITFQGVRNSLFSYSTRSEAEGGYADFDAIEVSEEPRPTIPHGKRIELSVPGRTLPLAFDKTDAFTVVDRGLGRVALEADAFHLSVGGDRVVSLRRGTAGVAETFQWMESLDGDLILMSLATNRYLRVDPGGRVLADSPGPRPDGQDGVRLGWRLVSQPRR